MISDRPLPARPVAGLVSASLALRGSCGGVFYSAARRVSGWWVRLVGRERCEVVAACGHVSYMRYPDVRACQDLRQLPFRRRTIRHHRGRSHIAVVVITPHDLLAVADGVWITGRVRVSRAPVRVDENWAAFGVGSCHSGWGVADQEQAFTRVGSSVVGCRLPRRSVPWGCCRLRLGWWFGSGPGRRRGSVPLGRSYLQSAARPGSVLAGIGQGVA